MPLKVLLDYNQSTSKPLVFAKLHKLNCHSPLLEGISSSVDHSPTLLWQPWVHQHPIWAAGIRNQLSLQDLHRCQRQAHSEFLASGCRHIFTSYFSLCGPCVPRGAHSHPTICWTTHPSWKCWDKFPYPASLHSTLHSSMDDLPFSCIQIYSTYPTQSACLGSTWLYLYFTLLSIWGYFLPSVLLTGSVIKNKKSISYSAQEQQGGWLLLSSLLSSVLSLSLIAAAILAEHKDCYKRGQSIATQTEKRVLWFASSVDTSMWDLLQSLSPALASVETTREAVHSHKDGGISQLQHLSLLPLPHRNTWACFKLSNRLSPAATHVG